MNARSRALRIFVPAVLIAASAALAFGQNPQGQSESNKPEFEVASIRPSAPLDMAKLAAEIQAGHMPRLGAHVDASLAEYRSMSLKELIATAYKVKAYQITGPPWLTQERYDIEAKMPAGAVKEDAPAMLQSLLADRFGLVAHRDSAEHKVLALVVGKDGPKLQPSPAAPPPIDENAPLQPGEMKIDGPDGPVHVKRNHDGSVTMNMGAKGVITQKFDAQAGVLHIESSTTTMAGFADMLTNVFQMGGQGGRQVVDMTGLNGNYQVAVDISLAGLMEIARSQGFVPPSPPQGSAASAKSPGAAASDPGGGAATVYSSVEKLGLKLDGRKATVEQLVIDKINKQPTAN